MKIKRLDLVVAIVSILAWGGCAPKGVPERAEDMFQIDLEKYNGDTSEELPLATTYVIDKSGVIRYAFLDANDTKRAELATVVEVLEAL